MKKVGFWYSEREPELPKPVAGEQPWKGAQQFAAVLTMIQMAMDNDHKRVDYRSGKGHYRFSDTYPDAEVLQYRGWSHCRICGEMNGSKEYHLGGFAWPQGYLHYLSEHHVEPDPEFKQFIAELAATKITVEGKPLTVEF